MSNSQIKLEEINFVPDKNSNTPIYKQIVDYINSKVACCDWVIGSKLPSQRELAAFFNVNRSTIVQAMDELKATGIIEGTAGGGTRIINNTWSLLMSSAPPNWSSYIKSGSFKSNIGTIQTINKQEFEEGIIRLGTGELSPELIPNILNDEIIKRVQENNVKLNYLGPLGLLELRQAISKYIKRFGINVSPNSILIVSGSLQALQLISVCMLRKGSTVYVELPSYLNSLQVFQSAGVKLFGVPMDRSGIMYWNMKVDNHASDNSSLLYTIPTIHNPTGMIMSNERRVELVNYCKSIRLPIIEDDAYRELWLEDEPPAPLKSLDDNGSILYLGTVSKTLAPGLRIGWIVGPELVVERLGDVKMQTDYGASSLSQWILYEWLESGLYERHLIGLKKHLLDRRNFVLDILNKYFKDIASWSVPKGGFYIWLRLNKKISTDKLFTLALNKKILINPGNIYDFSKNQYLRISYSYASLKDLEYGLKCLSEIIFDM